MLTVEQLIKRLQEIEDKTLPIYVGLNCSEVHEVKEEIDDLEGDFVHIC